MSLSDNPASLTAAPEETVDLLDDDTEICIDNVLWDYAGFIHSPAPELSGRERKYDIARTALRQRIRQLIEEARRPTAPYRTPRDKELGAHPYPIDP